jgi:hypothetical protein
MSSNKKNESKRLPTAKKALSRTPKRKMDMVDDEKHRHTHLNQKGLQISLLMGLGDLT